MGYYVEEEVIIVVFNIKFYQISNGQPSIQHEEIFYDARPNLKKPIMQTAEEPVINHSLVVLNTTKLVCF